MNFKITSLVTLAIILQACGGGGGGSNDTTDPVVPDPVVPDPVVPDPVVPDPQVYSEAANGETEVVSSYTMPPIYNAATDTWTSGETNTTQSVAVGVGENNLKLTTSDGFSNVTYSTNQADVVNYTIYGDLSANGNYGVIFGNYTKDGETFAFSKLINQDDYYDYFERVNAAGNTSWSISDVDYTYFLTDGAMSELISDSDGWINGDFNSGTWTAQLGDVFLDGAIDGQDVSGTATYTDGSTEIEGNFVGVDQSVASPGNTDPFLNESYGGFAGDNGGDNTFSGGWNWNEILFATE